MGKVVKRTVTPKAVRWYKCSACGHEQPRSESCIQCGQPRDPKNTKWLSKTSSATSVDVENAQNTVRCDSCDSPFDRRLKACPECGEPFQKSSDWDPPKVKVADTSSEIRYPESKIEPPEYPWSYQPRDISPTRSSGLPKWAIYVGIGLAIMAVFFLVSLLIANSIPHSTTVVLQDHVWRQYVEVSWIQTDPGDCWEGSCPAYTREISRNTQDYYSGERIKTGTEPYTCYDCEYEMVCEPDTTETREKTTCEDYEEDGVTYTECTTEEYNVTVPGECEKDYYPVEKERDVYGTATPYPRDKIYYEIDSVQTCKIWTDWVSGVETYYPEYHPDPRRQETFTGDRGGEYQWVLVDVKREKVYQYPIEDIQYWMSIPNGTKMEAEVSNLLGIHSIDMP